MGQTLGFIRGRGWKVCAVLVGVPAVGVGYAATVLLDTESVLPGWVAAFGFIGVATVLLIPSSKRTGHRPPRVPDGK